MVKLKIEDLAKLMGKTKKEVEYILEKQDVIELNLSEVKSKFDEEDELNIFE